MEQDELLEDYISDSFSQHEGISDKRIMIAAIAAQYSSFVALLLTIASYIYIASYNTYVISSSAYNYAYSYT